MRSAYKALETNPDQSILYGEMKSSIEKTKQNLIEFNNNFIMQKKTFINDLVVVNKVNI